MRPRAARGALRFTSRRDLVAAVAVVAVTAGTAVVAVGCRQNDDPDGARALYAEVTAGEGFRSWPRAPGYPGRTPSFTAHSSEVEIFVSPSLSDALDGPEQVREWPVGAIVVKEGFRDGERRLVAMMQKRQDGWYWAETDGEGEPLYSGKPAVCIDCHERRATYSDWVYSFELPR